MYGSLEFVGQWLAGRLLNAAWDAGHHLAKRPEVLICFESASSQVAKEFPDLFSDYLADALAISPDDVNLADRLQQTFGTRDFPRPRELSAMLLDSWRKRRDALRPSDAAPLFQKTEVEVKPFIDRLAELFFRELSKSDELRNPFIVSVLQEMLDAFLNVGTRSGGLALWPVNGSGMNEVITGKDNDTPNGDFRFFVAFQLLPGNQLVDLLQFEAKYWANGCPCSNLEAKLKIGGEEQTTFGDYKSLKHPIRLPSAGASLRYSRHLRPPLQKDIPADCDYGDLSVTIGYREGGRPDVITEQRLFKFLPGGVLESIASIRSVPRLDDEQLKACFDAGGIDRNTYDRLMTLDPWRRYMGARSDVGEDFVPNPQDLAVLRRILTTRCGLEMGDTKLWEGSE